MISTKIDHILRDQKNGLFYGNRLLLPFHAVILKVIVNDEIITDFSMESGNIEIGYEEGFMDIYFTDFDDFADIIDCNESIKLIAVDKGADVFDVKNHRHLVLKLVDPHIVTISENPPDILIID